MECFFVSDLHGKISRYKSLFSEIKKDKPRLVFIGGDLFSFHYKGATDLVSDFLIPKLTELKSEMADAYPLVFIIMGNDDQRIFEQGIISAQSSGIWHYIHYKKYTLEHPQINIYGYAFVPPTPFRLKDWEKYDVSRFTDVGSVPPDEGIRSVPVNPDDVEYSTIEKDLQELADTADLSGSVFLFHSPPYNTKLDRAALDGQFVDSVPLDVHVGSIAIRRFIEERQPYLTLHGHIHESSRITGSWKDQIGNTVLLSAAYEGPELALVKFNLDKPAEAIRNLIP
jgi:uncharacterized protein